MTYKKTNSNTQHQISPSLLIITMIVIVALMNPHAIYASNSPASGETDKNPREKNNALLISTENPNMSAEKDFDKIRGYESYDPITNTWSIIEKFKEVEILEDVTQHHDENYIYYSFWAYDSINHQWKRVDIRGYGYKNPSHVDEEIAKKLKKKYSFWKNLGVTLAAGGGATYYINTIKDLDLLVRKGQKEFLLQIPDSSDIMTGKAFEIRWFSKDLDRKLGLNHPNVVHDSQSSERKPSGNISFRGIGFNIPITLGLHYTFFKKLRIGVGNNFEVNYVKKLSPQGDAADMPEYEISEPWFYNWKLIGTIGYKVFQKGNHAVMVDTQLGVAFDYGEKWYPFGNFIHADFYGSIGAAHEMKLTDFFKFFYRLSFQFKRFQNASDFVSLADNKPSISSVTLWQPGLNLEIGTIFNFGRDKDSEDDEDSEDPNVTAPEENPSKQQKDDSQKTDKLLKGAKEALSKAQQAKTDTSRVRSLFK